MMNTILPVLMIVGAASQALGQDSKPVPAAAQSSQPNAEAIINRYLEVTGGRPAWEALQSLRGLGKLEVLGAGLTGNVSIFQTREGFYRSVDTGIGGAQLTVRNGDKAWSVRPDGVVAEIQGEELQKLLRDKAFNPLLNTSALYESMTLAGVEEVDGSQAWKVHCLPIGGIGSEEMRFFDIESGCRSRLSIEVRALRGRFQPRSTSATIAKLANFVSHSAPRFQLVEAAFALHFRPCRSMRRFQHVCFRNPAASKPKWCFQIPRR